MKYWKVSAKLYWCSNCNIPLINRECNECDSEGFKLHASPPKDIRPAFKGDLERLRTAIKLDYDNETFKALFSRNKLIFLNKVTYVDQADEVIIDGWPVGHLFYDPLRGKWRFKPVAEGVARFYKYDVGYYVIVSKRFKRGEVLRESDYVPGNIIKKKGAYIGLVLNNGKSVGLAVNDGNRLIVIKDWQPQAVHERDNNPTFKDVIKGNSRALRRSEGKAISFIKYYAKRYDKTIVSISGGKDSTALLYLAEKALNGDFDVLFNNTGIEAPQTIEYVKRLVSSKRLRIIWADAGEAFWRSIKVFGPPARDYRWCCKVCKLVPIAEAIKKVKGKILMLVGQRRYESLARARSSSVWRNRWIPRALIAAPINEWSALQVWLYLFMHNAPINPLYYEGIDRIGCWLCPASELGELEMVKKLMPKEWAKYERELLEWVIKNNLPRWYIKHGTWRWKILPKDQLKHLKRLGLNTDELLDVKLPFEIEILENNRVRFCIKFRYDLNKLIKNLSVLGNVKVNGETIEVISKGYKATINGDSGMIITEYGIPLNDVIIDVVGVIVRSKFCVLCGSCLNWCPNNALNKDGNIMVVNPANCKRCRLCIIECPIIEYYVSKNIHIINELP